MDPIPGPVLDAMARFREGTDDERDRATLQAYIDSGRADPAVSDALQQMLGAMSSGGNQGVFVIGDPRNPTASTFPAQSPATLPPAGSPPTTARPAAALPPPIQGSPPIAPGEVNTRTVGMATSPRFFPSDTTYPQPTPSPVSPMPTGGYGASNMLARAARQSARGEARGTVPGGGGTNWKGIENVGPTSAFADVNPGYLGVYADASNPIMASREIVDRGLPPGQHAPLTASALAPTVQSALAMAKMGMLGGGAKHGLGGPAGAGSQLARAENLINSLGPGAGINPAYVYTKALRMARKTPSSELGSDIGSQVETTQAAILGPLAGAVDQDTYTATKTMLDRAAMDWLDGVAHGTINPDLVSYPEYLRQQKKQHYLGR